MTEERIETIRKRAEQYAAGQITLQDFVMLEKAETEQPPAQKSGLDWTADAVVEAMAIRDRKEREAVIPTKSLTLKEFNTMKLHKQQGLYDKMPEEISQLIRGTASSVSVPAELLGD